MKLYRCILSVLAGCGAWYAPMPPPPVTTGAPINRSSNMDFFDEHLRGKKSGRRFDRFPTGQELDDAARAAPVR